MNTPRPIYFTISDYDANFDVAAGVGEIADDAAQSVGNKFVHASVGPILILWPQ